MFAGLLHFDWIFFAKKKSFLVLLVFFLGFGLFTSVAANFPFPETYKNSPYVITYVIGIMSLMCIFSVALLAAQSLMREKDAHFDLILYATPIQKRYYLSSRFLVIFGIAALTFVLYVTGLLVGHQLFSSHDEELAALDVWSYVKPFLVLAVPNILFCTGVLCSIGVLSKNRMAIYISGLFIYFLYWGIAMFSNSPLMASAAPVSAASMDVMAKVDPFGLSAFFEQTQYWTAGQRNTQLVTLTGNFLFNRMAYMAVSCLLVVFAYRKFSFIVGKDRKSNKKAKEDKTVLGLEYVPVPTKNSGGAYSLKAGLSFVKIDMESIIKSVSIWIIVLGWCFFFGMEVIGIIDAGRRLPERFATSGLMVSEILKLFPMIGLIVVLFYGSEIFWRSQGARFDALENSSPVPKMAVVLSKWLTLTFVPMLLLLCSCLVGIGFQLAFGTEAIDLGLYLSLYYLIGLPLSLCAALVISIHTLCKNRYIGLMVSSVVLLLTNTSFGGLIGLKHPLVQYANAFKGNYSEMNGFDLFMDAFHIKMLYWSCISAIVLFAAVRFRRKSVPSGRLKIGQALLLAGCLAGALFSGSIIWKETEIPKKEERNDWKQAYEERYKKFSELLQPTVTDVKTSIDLFPEKNSYAVTGTYVLANKGDQAIDSVLVYADKDMQWSRITIENAKLLSADKEYGHYWYKLIKPLQPGKSASMKFAFAYSGSSFNGFKQFSTILKNGSFIRISNFFPRFGYMADNEIDDPRERAKRKLPAASLVLPLEEKRETPYEYGYINLDAVISTSGNQTAIGIGDLKATWQKEGRNYFQYKTPSPIPFRFAAASARYAVQKANYRGIAIEVYYQPGHEHNIEHIIRNAKQSLEYCEQHFGKYPYAMIRFVEISSFVKGFAATAYPTGFFINESFGFQNNIRQDPEKDILNEQVSHELSHTWWGNATIDPDYREGSKLLTETLAMYTELVLYRKAYGDENIVSRVQIHKDIYMEQRAFAGEEPLSKADPYKPFLAYDKGMVVMYQLELLLGEENINKALRSFLKKYAYPNQPPISLDLINELYAVSDNTLHPKIDELFKQIITHDLQLDKVSYRKTNEGIYELEIAVIAKKYKEDGKGKKATLAFDEPIEIDIYLEDGKKQRVILPQGQSKLKVRVAKKPTKVVLDPRMRFMEAVLEDNEQTSFMPLLQGGF
ncbi:peptidase M1-like protein [Flavobacterium endophyticum]|uniref:Peptidase M1-like protein n=1 Tax=Flavobacterium endophyticum TaxID=1540163 RepID=A0A495MAQ5_9FLAO|nr:M1 family aminopeptidase [Flavobacterium endophyticum]RKS23171.1 peptidase M1-like protein [Flavobacterium endophyticum]